MTTKQVYFLRKITDYGNLTYGAEKVYEVEVSAADRFITEGKAVPVNFPSLDNYGSAIKSAVSSYTSHVSHIESNRLLSSHERQYKVKEAQVQLEEAVEELRGKYRTELAAQEIVAAQAAFKPAKPTEEALAFVDSALLQLKAGTEPKTVAELIRVQLPALDGPTKGELLRRIDEFKGVSGKSSHLFDELAPSLQSKDAAQQYRILQAIKADGNPAAAYDQLRAVHHTFSPRYLPSEVSAQFESDRAWEAAMAVAQEKAVR